jgi:hypothetical protein
MPLEDLKRDGAVEFNVNRAVDNAHTAAANCSHSS